MAKCEALTGSAVKGVQVHCCCLIAMSAHVGTVVLLQSALQRSLLQGVYSSGKYWKSPEI